MRFYYWTGLSWLILLPTYIVGAGLITLLWWWLAKRVKRSWVVIIPLYAVLAIAPWVEELWIARNFGQLCKKDAGIFVYKTVEVEGFYDVTGATLDLVRPGGYRFVESHSRDSKHPIRLSYGDAEFRRQALARYEKEYPGKNAAEQDMIRVKLDEQTEALVYPKTGDSWRIVKLDHPTARYQYTSEIYGKQIAHKITRAESRVTDNTSGEVIGRYVEYGRRRPWFFVGLSEPPYSCDGPDGGPNSKHNRLIYRDVLKPVK
jgi:hypothetical protein